MYFTEALKERIWVSIILAASLETVSREAARIIETHVISFNASVKYIVALGKRDFLYDAYYRHITRFARKGDKID